MTREEHIETLEQMVHQGVVASTHGVIVEHEVQAIKAGLEALRATAPKDEAAELEHCERVVALNEPRGYADTVRLVENQRAAVRAECADEIERLTQENRRLHITIEKLTPELAP